MPGLWAHRLYWNRPKSAGVVIGASAGGGYVPWQTSIITAMSLALAVRWSMSR